MDELRVSEVAKALASPVRVRILKILEGGERRWSPGTWRSSPGRAWWNPAVMG